MWKVWALESLDEELNLLCLSVPICGMGIIKVAISGAVSRRNEIKSICLAQLNKLSQYCCPVLTLERFPSRYVKIQHDTLQANPTNTIQTILYI